jgi:hypothetical protein
MLLIMYSMPAMIVVWIGFFGFSVRAPQSFLTLRTTSK